MTKSSLGKCYISNGGQRPRLYLRKRYLLPRGNRTWWPLGRPAPHEGAVQVPFDPSEPAQLHRNRQTLTTAGGNGTSRSEGLASTAAVSNEMLQAAPPVKPERARDHRRMAAPANPRDGRADIRVTSPVTKTFPPKKNDTRHAASESAPVLKGFWDWSR
jgi:hypothetical protein